MSELLTVGPGGDVSRVAAGRVCDVAFSLVTPPLICAISNKRSHVAGLSSAFVIKSAICCLVLQYRISTLGCEHTSNNQCTSMRCVLGKWRRAIERALAMILMTASLSSAMTRTVVWLFFSGVSEEFARVNALGVRIQFHSVRDRTPCLHLLVGPVCAEQLGC